MDQKIEEARSKWKRLRSTSGFHNAVVFLIFVAISALFWLILALNDSAQQNFNVRVQLTNVPDTVTFISDVPEKIHVNVRDKGTNLWRSGFMRHPSMQIKFKDYASKGILRFSREDIMAALKVTFGTSAQITSVSLDSLKLVYTTNKGKRVPVVVNSKIIPDLGSILEGTVKAVPSSVYVYGEQNITDTINKVVTHLLDLKDVSETTTQEVSIVKIAGVRIVPSSVNVTVPIEPLVKKQSMVTITPINVPHGESLLLFPSKVPVEYYVAMSRLGDDDDASIEIQVDYHEISSSSGDKLPVEVVRYPDRFCNLSLKTDSVEYTIVKE